VQFIKNFRSNNFATFDARPLRIPIHWCSRLGLPTVAPFLTISMRDLLRSTTTTTSCNKTSSSCSLRDLLIQVVGSIHAGTGREAVEDGVVDCSAFRVWGLYPDEVTRASSTSMRRDTVYTQLPEHFAQSSRTQAAAAELVPAMSHTKDSVWRLLTRLPADFDTALLSLFSTPQRTGGGGGGGGGGSGCLGLMLESCLLPVAAASTVGAAGRSGVGRLWPSDRILDSQQLVGEGKASSAALFKIGDSVDVLDGSHCWVGGEVALIDRVQSPDPARVFLVITVRVPATTTSSGQQVIQLLEGSTRVLRAGTITALLLTDEDRCRRYQHEYQPSLLGIASLLTDSYAASGLPFTYRDKQSTAAQTITIDLYGLAAREVHLLSRALSRGPGDRRGIGLKLLHLLVLTDGSLLLDSQCRGCAVVTSEDKRTGIYEATAWPRIVAQLHRLNNSVDPAVAFSSHLLGLREEQRREEQRRSTAAASRRDGDPSAVISRMSSYIRCSPLRLAKKNRQHTSRVSAVTVDSAPDQSTARERQQQDSKSNNNNNNYQANNNSSSHSQQHQQRSGTATTAQLTLQQYGSYPGGPHGGVTSLIGVAGTYLPTYLPTYLTLPPGDSNSIALTLLLLLCTYFRPEQPRQHMLLVVRTAVPLPLLSSRGLLPHPAAPAASAGPP
jgi:hypothetical protein